MQVAYLSCEDPLEYEMVTHSNIFAWKIPWTEEPVGYNPWGHKQLNRTEQLSMYTRMSRSGIAGYGR